MGKTHRKQHPPFLCRLLHPRLLLVLPHALDVVTAVGVVRLVVCDVQLTHRALCLCSRVDPGAGPKPKQGREKSRAADGSTGQIVAVVRECRKTSRRP